VCGSDDDRYGHAQTPSPRVIDELTAPDRAAVHGEKVPFLRSTPARLKDLLRPAASLDRQVNAYIRYPKSYRRYPSLPRARGHISSLPEPLIPGDLP
jgi:hypothetical protein